MRAIIVDESNKAHASSLSIGDADTPQVDKPNQVRVKVKAFGLNRMDIMQRKGAYPVPPGVSKIIGVEFAGTIDDAGEQAAKKWSKGDEV